MELLKIGLLLSPLVGLSVHEKNENHSIAETMYKKVVYRGMPSKDIFHWLRDSKGTVRIENGQVEYENS